MRRVTSMPTTLEQKGEKVLELRKVWSLTNMYEHAEEHVEEHVEEKIQEHVKALLSRPPSCDGFGERKVIVTTNSNS